LTTQCLDFLSSVLLAKRQGFLVVPYCHRISLSSRYLLIWIFVCLSVQFGLSVSSYWTQSYFRNARVHWQFRGVTGLVFSPISIIRYHAAHHPLLRQHRAHDAWHIHHMHRHTSIMFTRPSSFPNATDHLPPHLLALWPLHFLPEIFSRAGGSILLVGRSTSTILVKVSCLAY
jgi:hypothetical protein